jgi:hypothetical protein
MVCQGSLREWESRHGLRVRNDRWSGTLRHYLLAAAGRGRAVLYNLTTAITLNLGVGF